MEAYIAKKIIHYCNISVNGCCEIPEHMIDYFDFTFVLKGKMIYIADGQKYELKENDAIMLSPGTMRYRPATDTPAKYVSFNFLAFNDSRIPKLPFLKNVISGDIKKIISLFSLSHITPMYRSEEKLLNILNYILLELLNIIDFKSSNPHVIKMIKYINAHISEPISLRQVSEYVNLSKEYSANIFKKEINKTVIEYINERKMFLAKEMIQSGRYPLTHICESLGYENYSYFSRIFKKYFNTSPKHFEKESR